MSVHGNSFGEQLTLTILIFSAQCELIRDVHHVVIITVLSRTQENKDKAVFILKEDGSVDMQATIKQHKEKLKQEIRFDKKADADEARVQAELKEFEKDEAEDDPFHISEDSPDELEKKSEKPKKSKKSKKSKKAKKKWIKVENSAPDCSQCGAEGVCRTICTIDGKQIAFAVCKSCAKAVKAKLQQPHFFSMDALLEITADGGVNILAGRIFDV
jgi:hypothetical protein